MEGWAACGECGTRYDTATFGFCPRCGSLRRTEERTAGVSGPAAGAAATGDRSGKGILGPVRTTGQGLSQAARRLRTGGLLLLVVGLLGTASAGYALGPGYGSVQEGFGDLLDAQPQNVPGGNLTVVVLSYGQPTLGNITLLVAGTVVDSNTTGPDGVARFKLGDHGGVTLRIQAAGHTLERHLFLLEGQTTTLRLDVSVDAPTSPDWIGLEGFLRPVLLTALGLAGLLTLGGVSAALRRFRWVAFLAPLPMLLLSLAAAGLSVNLGGLVIFGVLACGYVLVVLGRSAFRVSR